jgi:hypothetical protein
MPLLERSTYKNKDAWTLSTPALSVVVIPSPGGKIASFLDRRTGREHLVQRPGAVYRDQPFLGRYVDGECSGFDDMFPTIDECRYESEPWSGTVLADHGEAWSLPWDCRADGEALVLSMRGVRLPYRLSKRVSLPSPATLRIDYTLVNESPWPMDFLWAAHVMAAMDEGSRLVVPPSCRTAMTVLSGSGRMGRYGDAVPWPCARAADGTEHRFDVVRPASVHDWEKYYFRDPLDEGWCAVRSPSGATLALSFPAAAVPYLGILLNENAWDDLYNIFLEPCTSTFDRVDMARLRGQCSRVAAGAIYRWHLCMTSASLRPGEDVARVREDGTVETNMRGGEA